MTPISSCTNKPLSSCCLISSHRKGNKTHDSAHFLVYKYTVCTFTGNKHFNTYSWRLIGKPQLEMASGHGDKSWMAWISFSSIFRLICSCLNEIARLSVGTLWQYDGLFRCVTCVVDVECSRRVTLPLPGPNSQDGGRLEDKSDGRRVCLEPRCVLPELTPFDVVPVAQQVERQIVLPLKMSPSLCRSLGLADWD